MNLITNR